MHLVIATRNRHKLEEIHAILDFPRLSLSSALDYPHVPDVEETADTFTGNATLKARALVEATGQWSLADDSGLEVDALNGAPGVYSARFAGEPVNYAANNQKLLRLLAGRNDRTARFRTVLVLAAPDGNTWTVDGTCEGRIIEASRGAGGFGYDPVFVPDGETLTFAEMPAEKKNRISHRARALAAAKIVWAHLLDHAG